jgi:4-hydroxyproline epimerase
LAGTTTIHVIDSHTGGEPTRVVIAGGPLLGDGPLSERLDLFRGEYDHFRSAIVNEPRGSDAIVGALLCEPMDPSCSTGVIFFNNVDYLGMCGHGTIGLVVTLAHLGKMKPGLHRIETPVGVVEARLHESGEVTITNVPSYRLSAGLPVEVPEFGTVTGDVAWGGNWFFLTDNPPVPLLLENVEPLTRYTWAVRQALVAHGITGQGGAEIDHIELSGPPTLPGAHSRNFVLCPGKSYDRSPCGTGTSAKLACLHAEGRLREGEVWVQESITGSLFEGSITLRDNVISPRIKGSAFVTAESSLILDERDPLRWGIPSSTKLRRVTASACSHSSAPPET